MNVVVDLERHHSCFVFVIAFPSLAERQEGSVGLQKQDLRAMSEGISIVDETNKDRIYVES